MFFLFKEAVEGASEFQFYRRTIPWKRFQTTFDRSSERHLKSETL